MHQIEKLDALRFLKTEMSRLREEFKHSLPFAMEPVVYEFGVNPHGTTAELLSSHDALLPRGYYALLAPRWLREDPRAVTAAKRAELDRVGQAARRGSDLAGLVESLFERMLPSTVATSDGRSEGLSQYLAANGFDREQHERIRDNLRRGLIGLAQNRLPASTVVEDVRPQDVTDARHGVDSASVGIGRQALAAGEVAVVTLAAGAGSRWTQGAGVVKALHPFVRLAGKHRSFLDIHVAKSRRALVQFGQPIPHVFTTGYLTHEPISTHLNANGYYGHPELVRTSPGVSVGLRFVPMVRDLRFAWEESATQVLDEQKQKVRESAHAALIAWSKSAGEGSDYTGNEPLQCLHPVGHWYELPNLLRNGVLRDLLRERPNLKYLLLHNIDTLGADLDAGLLGLHIALGKTLTFEVIGRRIEDRGGGLARVDGKVRILEGLAMPREEEEFNLSYYNSLTTWVDITAFLGILGLSPRDLMDPARVAAAVNQFASRMPTYVTLKDVKKRWGHGHEDIYPVCQFEKLWGDMTAVAGVDCGFVVVPRVRGQQLKDPAQLDGWLRDGAAEHVTSLCDF